MRRRDEIRERPPTERVTRTSAGRSRGRSVGAAATSPSSSPSEPQDEPPRIAVLYGESAAPFVAPIVQSMIQAATALRFPLQVISAEQWKPKSTRDLGFDRLYVLPFDVPGGPGVAAVSWIRANFPRIDILNAPEAHELCRDKLRAHRLLLSRGVPVPESLVTSSPEEVREFVAAHQFAFLKDPTAVGSRDHVVLCDSDEVLVGEAAGHRFVVELGEDPHERRRLREGVLAYPPPFFVQRLVGDAAARGVFQPGRMMRAYIVEGRVGFWTERYRDRYSRPSDWILDAGLGAKSRFVLETSAELRKLALRAADVLGMRIGVVDLVRAGAGAIVVEAESDGTDLYVDRGFKEFPEYRDAFDFDRMIVAAMAQVEIPILSAPL